MLTIQEAPRMPKHQTHEKQDTSPPDDEDVLVATGTSPDDITITTERPPRRETWADWIREIDPDYDEGADDYSTIDELVHDLNEMFQFKNVEISPSTIRYWQSEGVLPYPIKRWHEGATRALYPRRAAFWAILHLRALQMRGKSIEEIKPEAKNILRQRIASAYDPNPYDLEPVIQDVIRKRNLLTNDQVTKVEVSFFSDARGVQTYTFYPSRPDHEADTS